MVSKHDEKYIDILTSRESGKVYNKDARMKVKYNTYYIV